MRNQVQLITYVDRLSGGGFHALQALFEGPLQGLFGGTHLLPFYWPIDGADAGFDPIDHLQPDSRLGAWQDVRALAAGFDLTADLIVNHVSSRCPQFEDFRKHGSRSGYQELFLSYGRVFPAGASETDLLQIYRPRPGLPFTKVRLDDGTERLLWTTFTPEQIDIDVRSPAGRAYLERILRQFQVSGIRTIRLDAAGYAIKKPGTSCFMIPETFEFIAAFTEQAHALGMEVLVEIHTHYQHQINIAKQVDWVYDFALPPLVLHTLFTRNAHGLKRWLTIAPRNCVTVLDTHDGIGVIDVGPDRRGTQVLPGLLTAEELDALVETIHVRSNGESRQATGAAANNLDLYQVNCTYYDALGRRDDEYLIARALQFFAPGIPQVYYVGLLAGANDLDLLRRTGVGRDINRHFYSRQEIDSAAARPVVQTLFELIRFRNTHPAFSGEFRLLPCADHEIQIEWRSDKEWARLEVDLKAAAATIASFGECGERQMTLASGTAPEVAR
ncbi:MAG TPA: sucrose phosphorylase [Bryobacteraceae bacterium]|jgi:sucrose phosphorylase